MHHEPAHIADADNIPYQYLRKILQVLIKNKLVVSREGSMGGVALIKDPAAISIVDIIKIFQGNIQLAECMFRKQLCSSRNGCVLRQEIKRVEKIVEREFKGITLARLLKSKKQK